jgi:class 3 adenylate cyclase/predicted ATPase
MEARGVTDGERKSITALFADIKGSTDLIADLDPEEARAILDPTLKLMMDAVHRYEGYVAQSLGDGIFALFGAPIAHEDHPQRALYAALLMQDKSRKRAEQLRREKGINLQLRVGVNTGEVVLRSIRKDDLHTDYVPVGQSTNLASRMESLATPGSIVVSEQTYKLTEGYFEFKALGQAQVKGFNEPLNIYEVAGVGPLRTKLQLSVRRRLARFVGRRSELEQLQRALESAKAGHGQIAGVMGEPGVGKSRLFYEFKLLSQRGCLVLETFSVSHGKAYPCLPLIDLLKNYFQLTNHDDERRRREKITGKVLTLDRSLEDTLPYLFFLLGIAQPTSPLQQMDPQIRRKRILEAIKRLLLRESFNQPLIIIFEDLHWLDAETQAFLQLLSESVATARILLMVNYRPEYQQPWSGKAYFAQLRLDPLGKEQAEEMLTALLGDASESPPPRWERARERVPDTDLSVLKRFILDKTEGNPFFMEEIVQTLREQGMFSGETRRSMFLPTDLRLPTTVQGVLSARMDRLPSEEKSLLQTLAVIGREFSASLLRKVVTDREDDLHRLLSRLQAGEFVYEQSAFPEVEYIFKHALTQEVAYNSLLIERRKVLHERTAQAIEEVYPHRLDDHYSELAYHYSRSGNTQKAVDYLQLAGQQAVQRSANSEAITHLTGALELLKTLPDTPERAQQELTLLIALGAPLQATKGWAAPEMGTAYTRAQELCQQLGEDTQLFMVLWGAWQFHVVRAEYMTAHDLAQQLLHLAHSRQDSASLIQAYYALGLTLICQGEFVTARECFEQGVLLYDPQLHNPNIFLYGFDPKVGCLFFAAWALCHLGYPKQSLSKLHQALALAQELSHPFTTAGVLSVALWVHQLLRNEKEAQEQAEILISLCNEQGFTLFMAWGTISQGWALAEQGKKGEGIVRMNQGLASHQATGAAMNQTRYLALLAEAYGKQGQTEEGLSALAEALKFVHKTGERNYEAELYRLKGELTLQQSKASLEQVPDKSKASQDKSEDTSPQPLTPSTQEGVEEAEGYFCKAIEIARKQQAKSLELRATISLARLWRSQGKQHDAHRMLSEIYNWDL